jgi:diacylglycerol kinase family enzyme
MIILLFLPDNANDNDNSKVISSSDITLAVIPFGTGNDWTRTHYHQKQYHNWKNTITLLQKKQKLKTVWHDIGVVQYNNNKSINDNNNTNEKNYNMNDDVTKKYFINVAGLAYDAYVVK